MKKTPKMLIAEILATPYQTDDPIAHRLTSDQLLAALDDAGYAVVPKEPTEEMLRAGEYVPLDSRKVWSNMLAAAPERKKAATPEDDGSL